MKIKVPIKKMPAVRISQQAVAKIKNLILKQKKNRKL